jgi:di/tricarboxylate transporter
MIAMYLTFAILAITIAMFIWGKLPSDLVALMALLALYLTGILNVQQTLAGFGDSTVIMIAALFVVGEGLSRSGVTAWLSSRLYSFAGGSVVRLLAATMAVTAGLSAFMSNTGAVAALMPAVVAAAWGVGSVPGKFLMPLAYAANSGGLLTLTGTPPNIVVADTLAAQGFEPFSYFSYGLIGLPLLLIVVAYMVTVGVRMLPARSSLLPPEDLSRSVGQLADAYSLHGKIFRLRVRSQSPLAGMTLAEARLGSDYEITVISVKHGNGSAKEALTEGWGLDDVHLPSGNTVLRPGDVLLVRATAPIIERAMVDFNFGVQMVDERREPLTGALLSHEIGLAEVLVTPRSSYIGQTLAESEFKKQFGVQVLGVLRNNTLALRQRVKLQFGDSLLVRGAWEDIERLAAERRSFVVVGRPEAMAEQVVDISRDTLVAGGILIAMIALMVSGLVSTVIAALMAAVAMMLFRCIRIEQAYRAISWSSVVLIAAMIPMSTALDVTGGAELIASSLVSTLGALGPLALMAGVFILTSGFSQVISNTATTVLVAPIVLTAALSLGLSPYPFLMIVAVGASSALLTPIGTPPNLMVMAPGGYSFSHYARVGLPLLVLFLAVSLVLIPMIWPFYP